MRRRAVQLAVLVSLSLCLLMLVAWVTSHWFSVRTSRARAFANGYPAGADQYQILHGAFRMLRIRETFLPGPPTGLTTSAGEKWRMDVYSIAGIGWGPFYFRFSESEGSRTPVLDATPAVIEVQRVRLLIVPLWVPAAAFAVGPALWWRSRRHVARGRDRLAAGQCVACGYDLRAGHTRCPECGGAIGHTLAPAGANDAR